MYSKIFLLVNILKCSTTIPRGFWTYARCWDTKDVCLFWIGVSTFKFHIHWRRNAKLGPLIDSFFVPKLQLDVNVAVEKKVSADSLHYEDYLRFETKEKWGFPQKNYHFLIKRWNAHELISHADTSLQVQFRSVKRQKRWIVDENGFAYVIATWSRQCTTNEAMYTRFLEWINAHLHPRAKSIRLWPMIFSKVHEPWFKWMNPSMMVWLSKFTGRRGIWPCNGINLLDSLLRHLQWYLSCAIK